MAQFEFKPWEGSITFGDQLRHIASSERTLVAALRHGTWMWEQGIDKRSYPNPASVDALLQETADELKSVLADCSEGDLLRSVRVPWDLGEWNPAGVIIEWISHECHHLGQLCLHLRLCGVVPPPYA